jgi:hypothetical protein
MWSALPITRDSAIGEEVARTSRYFAQFKPRLVLTGTSHFSDLERNSWVAARESGIPSVCAIDAWVNFPERFTRHDGTLVQPDSICVIDAMSRATLKADNRITAAVHVCGQPHLETLVATLLKSCATRRPNGKLLLVFFSNPVSQSLPRHEQPYNQFKAATLVVDALRNEDVDLLIKPHPREDIAGWEQWILKAVKGGKARISITSRSSDELLVACDATCGITSMSLIEAALVGRPVLSVQPGRLRPHNPVMDELDGVKLAMSEDEVPGAVATWLAEARDSKAKLVEVPASIKNSRQNYLRLLDRLLGAPQ